MRSMPRPSSSKNSATARNCSRAVLDRIHARAEADAARQLLHVPADVLARAAHAGVLAVQEVVILQVVQQQAPHVGDKRRRELPAGREEVRNLAEDPRSALRCAADHDRVGAGVSEHFARLRRRVDVAVGDHGHAHRGLHGGDGVVFSMTAVALLARAAVHGEHLHSAVLERASQGHGVAVLTAPAGAHLQGDGHATRRACLDDRLRDRDGERLVLHQRGARPLVADLLGRAAHVDVDDLRAAIDVVGRRLGHHGGVRPGDLHRDRARFALVVRAPRCLQAVPQLAARRDHLAHRIARAELAAQLAEGTVGDARHRRREQVVREGVRADVHAKGKRRCC